MHSLLVSKRPVIVLFKKLTLINPQKKLLLFEHYIPLAVLKPRTLKLVNS